MKSLNDIPDEVLIFKMLGHTGIPVGVEHYERMITTYPEHFPEEVDYKEKWSSVPDEVKDEYFKSIWSTIHIISHTEIGDIPYPEVAGIGIIGRIKVGETEEGRTKLAANDEWYNKLSLIKDKEDKELFNRLFSPYGLTK